MTLKDLFIAARRTSAPLLVARTPDPASLVGILLDTLGKSSPALVHDIVRGIMPLNPAGSPVATELNGGEDPAIATGNPVDMLRKLTKAPERVIVFVLNAHKLWTDPGVLQGIWNLRDLYKQNRRTLVLVTPPGEKTPPELQGDIIVLDETRPDRAALVGIANKLMVGANLPPLAGDVERRVADALSGLAAFSAETAVSLCLNENGLDVPSLWQQKYAAIEQVAGLSVYRGTETFEDIGGCDVAKNFITSIRTGKDPYSAVIWMDEIEKALAGSGTNGTGDSSGTSQFQLGALLTYLQNTEARGLMFIGHPGSAKSLVAKAAGNEAKVPTILYDLGAMKNSLVGQSEANILNANDVIQAISGGKALWIATCNSIGVLPPEFRRRFTLGTFFFDLPSEAEQAKIVPIFLKKYGLKKQPLPNIKGWTGAEIKQLCYLASMLDISLLDAAAYVVPLARSAADRIERLRQECNGRYLSANVPGVYMAQGQEALPPSGGRAISLPEMAFIAKTADMKES
jgi:hypothetical protein